MSDIEIESRGHTRLLRIARPSRLNALDQEASAASRDAFRRWADDDDVRAIIITGEGNRSFCVGSDLKAMRGTGERDRVSIGGITKDVLVFKPVIAAVNGLAFGGGLEIVLACDLRLAVPTARFGLPEPKVGLIAGGGGTARLQDNLPWAIAADVLLRGRVLDADEALHFGLINAIVEPDKLIPTAWEWANEVASLAPLAIQATKEAMWRSRGMDLQTALSVEQNYSDLVKRSEDAKEGVHAFIEGREPEFRGR